MRAIVFLLLVAVGCGRSPGPNEDEYGYMVAWQINSAALSSTCSDHPDVADLLPAVPDLNNGMVHYMVYAADHGGKTATDYVCPRPFTNWNDCSPGDAKWTVSGHTLSMGGTLSAGAGAGECWMTAQHSLTLVDDGDEAAIEQTVTLTLDGPAADCDSFDENMRAKSPNGRGVNGCAATLALESSFVLVKDW